REGRGGGGGATGGGRDGAAGGRAALRADARATDRALLLPARRRATESARRRAAAHARGGRIRPRLVAPGEDGSAPALAAPATHPERHLAARARPQLRRYLDPRIQSRTGGGHRVTADRQDNRAEPDLEPTHVLAAQTRASFALEVLHDC